jgi:hypothetical protein
VLRSERKKFPLYKSEDRDSKRSGDLGLMRLKAVLFEFISFLTAHTDKVGADYSER